MKSLREKISQLSTSIRQTVLDPKPKLPEEGSAQQLRSEHVQLTEQAETAKQQNERLTEAKLQVSQTSSGKEVLLVDAFATVLLFPPVSGKFGENPSDFRAENCMISCYFDCERKFSMFIFSRLFLVKATLFHKFCVPKPSS